MKVKDRIEKLEGLVALLRKEFEEAQAKWIETEAELDEAIECCEVRELMELSSNVPRFWYRYSFRDVSHLLEWEELPMNAGPLFFTVLIGISGLAGLCYGFTHPKCGFAKLIKQNMGISEPVLADLLYECKGYIHEQSTWVPGVVIGTVPREEYCTGAIFYGMSPDDVFINVIELAQCYLRALNKAFETGDAGAYSFPHPPNPGPIVRDAARALLPPESSCEQGDPGN